MPRANEEVADLLQEYAELLQPAYAGFRASAPP
jgi:hypothetical protein